MTLQDGIASVTSVVPLSDGRDALSFLVEEDPTVIIASLEKAHREQVWNALREFVAQLISVLWVTASDVQGQLDKMSHRKGGTKQQLM